MKTYIYIAQTQDSFIADEKGSVAFLDKFNNPKIGDYGYNNFIKSITHTIMGNTTYQQILSFGVEFPYKQTTNFVYSNSSKGKEKYISYTKQNPKELLNSLPENSKIWIIGGSKIINEFLKENLVDEMIIFTMPTHLKKGIPLFQNKFPENFKLEKTINYENNVIENYYIKQK